MRAREAINAWQRVSAEVQHVDLDAFQRSCPWRGDLISSKLESQYQL